MDQYPPANPHDPVQQQPPPSPEELEAPARRAGILMIALGVVAALLGILSVYRANTFDPAELNSVPEARKQLDEQIAMLESVGLSLHGVWVFTAGVTLAVGAVMGALGFGVRAGKMVPVVLAMMLAAVLLLFMLLAVLGGLVQGAASGSALMLLQSCFPILMAGAMVVLLVWLVRAARAAPHLAYARQLSEYHAAQYDRAREYYRNPGAGAPAAGPQPGPPPAAAGGYHQYPAAPPPQPAHQTLPTQPAEPARTAPPPESANPGDPPDGPATQG